MESLTSNKPLLYSLVVSSCAVMILATGFLPDLMTQFQLVQFDSQVRTKTKAKLYTLHPVSLSASSAASLSLALSIIVWPLCPLLRCTWYATEHDDTLFYSFQLNKCFITSVPNSAKIKIYIIVFSMWNHNLFESENKVAPSSDWQWRQFLHRKLHETETSIKQRHKVLVKVCDSLNTKLERLWSYDLWHFTYMLIIIIIIIIIIITTTTSLASTPLKLCIWIQLV